MVSSESSGGVLIRLMAMYEAMPRGKSMTRNAGNASAQYWLG
jgi:hypothetical protein